ncbi:hypothetical protein KDA23_06790 [Candidatus Saccharibacteria bacterium]|nr:hypothetical protein [Candidatus Saccharibacteria bacterium]
MTERNATTLADALVSFNARLDEIELRAGLRNLTEPERILVSELVAKVLKISDVLAVEELVALASIAIASNENPVGDEDISSDSSLP